MKLNPLDHKDVPDYPAALAHIATRRKFLATVGLTGAGLGICGIMSSALAQDEKGSESKEPEEAVADLKVRIEELSAKLNDKQFKVRKDATEALIEMGKEKMRDGKDKNATARTLVLERMNILVKDKDPEVKERAKEIIVALTPRPPVKAPVDQRPALGGVIIAPQ